MEAARNHPPSFEYISARATVPSVETPPEINTRPSGSRTTQALCRGVSIAPVGDQVNGALCP